MVVTKSQSESKHLYYLFTGNPASHGGELFPEKEFQKSMEFVVALEACMDATGTFKRRFPENWPHQSVEPTVWAARLSKAWSYRTTPLARWTSFWPKWCRLFHLELIRKHIKWYEKCNHSNKWYEEKMGLFWCWKRGDYGIAPTYGTG